MNWLSLVSINYPNFPSSISFNITPFSPIRIVHPSASVDLESSPHSHWLRDRPTNLTDSLARCELRCVLYMAAATEYGREGGQPGTATDGQKQKSGEPPPAAAAAAKVCVQSVGHDGDSLAPVRILHSLPPPKRPNDPLWCQNRPHREDS